MQTSAGEGPSRADEAGEKGDRGDRAFLLGAMLVAGLVAAVFVALAPIPYYNDAFIYLGLGSHLRHGQGFDSGLNFFPDVIQPVTYPALIALGAFVTTPLRAAVVVCVLASMLTVPALVRIHRASWGAPGWRYTAAVAALYPTLGLDSLLTTEPVFLCLLTWAVALAFEAARTGAIKRAAGAGVLLALVFMTRPEGVLLAGGLGLLLLLCSQPIRRRLMLLGAMVALAAPLLIGYGLFVQGRTGAFSVTPKARYNWAMSHVMARMVWPPDQVGMSARDQRVYTALMPDRATLVLDHAVSHPGFDLGTAFPLREPSRAQRVRELVTGVKLTVRAAVLTFGFLNPLAALLLLLAAVRAFLLAPGKVQGLALPPAPRGLVLLLFLLAAAHALPAVASGEQLVDRFLAAAAVLLVPLAGGGLHLACAALARGRSGKWAALVAAAVALGSYGFFTARLGRQQPGSPARQAQLRDMARACREQVPRGARVTGATGVCAFAVEGRGFTFPYVESADELSAYVNHHQIAYATLEEGALAKHPSAFVRSLAEPRRWPAWFTLVQALPGSARTWLVRLESGPPSTR